MAALRLDVSLGHELHDWRAQGVPHLAGDGLAVRMQHVIVLSGYQPHAVWLHATGGDDDVRLPGFERIAHVDPGHLLEPHRVRRGKRIGRIDAVVRILRALPTAHVTRIRLATLP